MPSPTDFNVSPYYDDFTESKKFHRILFRPAFAVQARELTQSQTQLQNQIERLSDHLIDKGAMIIPGEIGYDLRYYAVKLTSKTATNLSDYVGSTLTGATSGVTAKVINSVVADGTDPDTLFVQKIDDVKFRISGLSTSLPFTFTGLGTGTHFLKVAEPNKQALILIDNIIQTPITNKKLSVQVADSVGPTDQGISVTTGIASISKGDVIKLDDEFLKVKQVGDSTFAQARTAVSNSTVATGFYYDTKRVNSSVTTIDNTFATMDDNPPY